MRDGLHVFYVVFEAEEVAEAEDGEHFDGGFLFADEFSFNALEAKIARELDDFVDHRAGEAAATVFRQDQHADAADVAFPAAELLVERGVADDFAIDDGEERKIAAEVNVLAPIADDLRLRDAMFDEHALLFRHFEEELVEFFLVVFFEGTERALEFVLKDNFLGKLLEFEFERHSFFPDSP